MTGGVLGSATLEAMMAAGLSPQEMLVIVKAMEADRKPVDRTAAERMARYREKKRRNVTRNPPNEVYSNPHSPSETKVSSGEKRVRATPTLPVPGDIPAEPWEAFEQMRRDKKKPLKDFARKQLWGRLRTIAAAGWNIEDVIAKAVVCQHDGFWMPDGRDSNIRKANEPRAGPVNIDEYRERLARIGKAEA